ncbi:hypothetical protein CPB85DRAFT_1329686 [Mucidula mucida]|nr:hypothetical protein CPB85DRAFT_1329686 [Mucidula mucida]
MRYGLIAGAVRVDWSLRPQVRRHHPPSHPPPPIAHDQLGSTPPMDTQDGLSGPTPPSAPRTRPPVVHTTTVATSPMTWAPISPPPASSQTVLSPTFLHGRHSTRDGVSTSFPRSRHPCRHTLVIEPHHPFHPTPRHWRMPRLTLLYFYFSTYSNLPIHL